VRDAERCRLLPKRTPLSAIDSSGFEAHHVSHYFVRRRARNRERTLQLLTYRRFPKLGLVVDCRTHFILAAVPGRGPSPDHPHLIEAVLAARTRRRLETLLADAGYDAEWVHQFLRDELDLRSLIPPEIGRQTTKPPTGRYRRQMKSYFRRPQRRRRYGQRWQAETVISMLKRRLGECVNARSDRRQRRALLLKAITHNILILFDNELFYRARMSPYLPPYLLICLPPLSACPRILPNAIFPVPSMPRRMTARQDQRCFCLVCEAHQDDRQASLLRFRSCLT